MLVQWQSLILKLDRYIYKIPSKLGIVKKKSPKCCYTIKNFIYPSPIVLATVNLLILNIQYPVSLDFSSLIAFLG